MMWGYVPGIGGWGWLGPLFSLAFWGLIVAGVVVIVRVVWPGAGTRAAEGGPDAMAILQRRYASGELTRDQFIAMKRDIEGG